MRTDLEHLNEVNILVHAKDKLEPREGVYSIECKICEQIYIWETKRKLAVRVKTHKEEVEKIMKSMVYTRDSRKQSEGDRWKSTITDHTVKLHERLGAY